MKGFQFHRGDTKQKFRVKNEANMSPQIWHRYLHVSKYFQKFKLFFILTILIWLLTAINLYMLHWSTTFKKNNLSPDLSLKRNKAMDFSLELKNTNLENLSDLLENIWNKLEETQMKLINLESLVVRDTTTPSSASSAVSSSPKHLSECDITNEDMINFSACKDKIQWMLNSWKTDPCYAEYGVDGGICSIRYYLSQVENWCPPLPKNVPFTPPVVKIANRKIIKASWNRNLSQLISLMDTSSSRNNYAWIMERIARLWHLWVDAADSFQNDEKFQLDNKMRSQRKILIYLGFLSKKSGFRIQQSATAGGPLGELVQWSDILSALFVMDHKLIIISEYEELIGMLNQLPNIKSQCQSRSQLPYDMIVTDITGLIHFKKYVKQGYGKFSCLLRIIDTFGTEAAYNNLAYSRKFRKYKTSWGGQELDLRQFYTMFPHSPDNSFMGFVVEQHLNTSEFQSIERKQQAVVYGKSLYMWSGKEAYLSVINKYVEVHATVFTQNNESYLLPKFVINHGIMPGADLHRLLSESKLFIGLGFPYEGPAPLEAIAAGCVFINPKFNPPHSSLNTKFFKGKPTARELTSQHPYAEDFISHPNVFTVDISNLKEVEKVIKEALQLIENNTVKPYLPFEYTHKGMLQRLNTYMEHQDFCPPLKNLWPPEKAIRVVVSRAGQSCKDACWSRNMICEPSHFKRINKKETFDKIINSKVGLYPAFSSLPQPFKHCNSMISEEDLHHPSIHWNSSKCILQGDNYLFSCVNKNADHFRICPCRHFIRGQIALCPDCL